MNNDELLTLLACPSCGGALAPAASAPQSELACANCHTAYPRIGGLWWLFENPSASLQEWKSQSAQLVRDYDARIDRLKGLCDKSELLESTRERLRKLRKALIEQKKTLEKILAPLEIRLPNAKAASLLDALRAQLPANQNLLAYDSNLHRDWAAWGEHENSLSFELVNSAISQSSTTPKQAVVLGSGASRLVYDLHQAWPATHWLALDHNPLLLFAAHTIMAGTPVELYEFPPAPLDAEALISKSSLRAPRPQGTNLRLLLGDLWKAPLKNECFDLVITPWLIDILPYSPLSVLQRINALLKPNAEWIYTGSLVFHRKEDEDKLLPDELFELYEQCGFEILSSDRHESPYLQSPHNSHTRLERVLRVRARKARSCLVSRQESSLASWLEDPQQPIPRLPDFQALQISHEIQASVLALVDGQRSLRELGARIEELYGMDSTEALQAISRFLSQLSQRR